MWVLQEPPRSAISYLRFPNPSLFRGGGGRWVGRSTIPIPFKGLYYIVWKLDFPDSPMNSVPG